MLGLEWLTDPVSGEPVSARTIITLSAVWCATLYISEGLAALRSDVTETDDNGAKKIAKGHPVHRMWSGRPHPFYTKYDFLQAIIMNACLGDGYARIHFDGYQRPYALEHLPREIVTPEILPDGSLVYRVNGPSIHGVYGGPPINVTLRDWEVIHIKGPSLTGIIGENIPLIHRTNFSSALAAQKYSAHYFQNAISPSGYITQPGSLTKEQRASYEKKINDKYAGVTAAGRIMMLDSGMDLKKFNPNPQEAALLDFRRQIVEEVSRIFKVPQHLLSQLMRSTFSNMEQQSAEFVQYTLYPWVEKTEQEFNSKLFWLSEQYDGRFKFEFDLKSMLRADSEARSKYYQSLIQSGVMQPNEARAEEGLNPYEGGNRLFIQANMMPLDRVDSMYPAKQPAPQTETAPPPKQ